MVLFSGATICLVYYRAGAAGLQPARIVEDGASQLLPERLVPGASVYLFNSIDSAAARSESGFSASIMNNR